MSTVLDILTALAAPLAQLIESALAPTYDPEQERQAFMAAARALEDLRIKQKTGG